ncbi:MAG: autotransporter outer membrane beta-barrel domain-containing protein [Afipia sp.]
MTGGAISGNAVATGNFDPGDTLTVTVSHLDPGEDIGLRDNTAGAQLVSNATASFTYVFPAAVISHQMGISMAIGATANFSWVCTSAPQSSQSSTDSQKLRAVQVQGSTMVAQASGAAITGAVGNAINDAFSTGANLVTFGPNGMTFNFAAEPRSRETSANDRNRAGRPFDAGPFSAMAYAGGYLKAPPPPTFERRWSLWADIRGTGWDRVDTATAGLKGTQINVTAGLGYKVLPDVLVGLFGGYENFNYEIASLTGKLDGSGGTVGGYAAWRIAPTLRWDTMVGWSGVSYDATAGTASGNFSGSRWLASTGLTGSYRFAAYVFEPSAKVYALWERQAAWTDSLGTLQAQRDFSVGRVSLGGRVLAPVPYASVSLSPYLGFYGDWRFSTDNAVPVAVGSVGLADGWSGRVTGGVTIAAPGGGALALGGEYGGIGAGYGVWTANARASWPF